MKECESAEVYDICLLSILLYISIFKILIDLIWKILHIAGSRYAFINCALENRY